VRATRAVSPLFRGNSPSISHWLSPTCRSTTKPGEEGFLSVGVICESCRTCRDYRNPDREDDGPLKVETRVRTSLGLRDLVPENRPQATEPFTPRRSPHGGRSLTARTERQVSFSRPLSPSDDPPVPWVRLLNRSRRRRTSRTRETWRRSSTPQGLQSLRTSTRQSSCQPTASHPPTPRRRRRCPARSGNPRSHRL
jgi:hypothetical protein